MKFIVTRELGSLRPVDDRGRDLLSQLKVGFQYQVEVKRPRNIKELRLYWALIHLIFPNQSTWLTEEDLSDAIKCAVGHCETTTLKDGKIMVRPKSIAFSKADQDQWKAFLDRVIQLVITKIIPGTTEEHLRAELETITGLR